MYCQVQKYLSWWPFFCISAYSYSQSELHLQIACTCVCYEADGDDLEEKKLSLKMWSGMFPGTCRKRKS